MRSCNHLPADSPSCHQLSSHQKQIAVREQRKQLSPVLGETTLAALHLAKLAFDDPEAMLSLRPHIGDYTVCRILNGVQLAALRSLAHGALNSARPIERGLALGADIAFFGPNRGLGAMQPASYTWLSCSLAFEVCRLCVTPLLASTPM